MLVVDEDRVDEAITRLSKVGFDNVKGYLKGGFASWEESGKEIGVVDTISAEDFQKTYDSKKINVFDVRKLTEYQSEHIINAKNIPLNDLMISFQILMLVVKILFIVLEVIAQ